MMSQSQKEAHLGTQKGGGDQLSRTHDRSHHDQPRA